ncbi:hypothetical protein BRYFOR_05858 [Marvinbryantia formatexigens DSM 14469]|uniref:Uncharacterized protein n=1 Tax=Marvinbryantia formatexigens DSM 14469 TaxID=478749 RepID=C6LB62_9FIRM|nr:hypothetical protein BRYFOR_05858 [Marvinbryantia formatexigens DSM 14469]
MSSGYIVYKSRISPLRCFFSSSTINILNITFASCCYFSLSILSPYISNITEIKPRGNRIIFLFLDYNQYFCYTKNAAENLAIKKLTAFP